MLLTDDHQRVREAAGLLERPDRAFLLLTGAEAAEFLQGQVSNDVEGLAPGTGCYAALLTHKGKLRADMRILRGEGWILVDLEPGGLAPMRRTVSMYSLGRDVRWEEQTGARAVLSLVGPDADHALEAVPAAVEHAFVEGEHGLHVRTEHGVDVICPSERAGEVAEALGVPRVSEDAVECLRIESGRPRMGLDMDADTIPQEAGLNERAVSFSKGCYVGQETVARLFYKGRPNRHLRGLRLSTAAHAGAPVRLGEREVGRVGSVCVSPVHGPIALALLRREAEPGALVQVGEEGASAQVAELPFRSG